MEAALPAHHALRAGASRGVAQSLGIRYAHARRLLHQGVDTSLQNRQRYLSVQVRLHGDENGVEPLGVQHLVEVRVALGHTELVTCCLSRRIDRIAYRGQFHVVKSV